MITSSNEKIDATGNLIVWWWSKLYDLANRFDDLKLWGIWTAEKNLIATLVLFHEPTDIMLSICWKLVSLMENHHCRTKDILENRHDMETKKIANITYKKILSLYILNRECRSQFKPNKWLYIRYSGFRDDMYLWHLYDHSCRIYLMVYMIHVSKILWHVSRTHANQRGWPQHVGKISSW